MQCGNKYCLFCENKVCVLECISLDENGKCQCMQANLSMFHVKSKLSDKKQKEDG